MKLNKKAQMKMQETAFVLMALVLLFSFVFLFYFKFQSAGIAKKAEAAQEQRALSMLDKIMAMPELSCSAYAKGVGGLCIDKDKLKSLMSAEGYDGMWSRLKEVKIAEVYPGAEEFIIYSSEDEQKQEYSTFASVCEQQVSGYKCTIGMISVAI